MGEAPRSAGEPDSYPGPSPAARRRRAELAILAVTVIWGAAFVWMKQALDAGEVWFSSAASGDAAPPAENAAATPARLSDSAGALAIVVGALMSLRFGFAALALALVSRRARQTLDAPAWRGGLVLGGLLALGFFLQLFGLARVTPSVSAFLTSLYVLFTAACESVIARRPPRVALVLGALLATGGAAIIGGPPGEGAPNVGEPSGGLVLGLGEWLTIASAAVFALHIVLTDRITKRVDPMGVTQSSFVVVAAASIALTCAGFASHDAPSPAALGALIAAPDFLLPLAALAVLATLVAITLMNLFQRELHPVRAAILYAIEPVWAALIAISLGVESPTRWLFLGGGALLLGNWVAELGPRRRD